jgi:hypothetical protein
MGCESLKSIKFEEGLEEIAIYAFVCEDGLIEPDSIVSNNHLNEIYIPSTMKKISEYAFALSRSYNTKLYYNGFDFSSIESNDLCQTDIQYIGLAGSSHTEDGYFGIEGWAQTIDYNLYLYSEAAPSNEGNYWHYVDGNITIWE